MAETSTTSDNIGNHQKVGNINNTDDDDDEIRWTDDKIRWTEDHDHHGTNDENKEGGGKEEEDAEDRCAYIDPFKDQDPFDTFSFRYPKRLEYLDTTSSLPTTTAIAEKTDDENDDDQGDTASCNEWTEISVRGYKTDSDQVWQSTGLTLWQASTYLCEYMTKHATLFHHKRILEVRYEARKMKKRARQYVPMFLRLFVVVSLLLCLLSYLSFSGVCVAQSLPNDRIHTVTFSCTAALNMPGSLIHKTFFSFFPFQLGAGLGMCGILAHRLGRNSTVCITDGDTDALVHLRENVKRNQAVPLTTRNHHHTTGGIIGNNQLVQSSSDTRNVTAAQLLWGHDTTQHFIRKQQQQQQQQNKEYPETGTSPTTFDILIASDIIYALVIVEPLWETVNLLLSRHEEAVFIMAYAQRDVPVTIDIVLQAADNAGLTYELVDENPQGNIWVYHFRWKREQLPS